MYVPAFDRRKTNDNHFERNANAIRNILGAEQDKSRHYKR